MQPGQKYFSQLDGLRAIAITLVIIFHWFPEGEGINTISNGPLGVTLFFVLSGFLITRILIGYRSKLEVKGLTNTYKTFMIRRTLRIFPLYYFVLLSVWLAKYISFLQPINTQLYSEPLYYILYGSNFLIEKSHDWADVLSPFWSLAVEEQFYLVWPLVILTVPKEKIKVVIQATIVLGILIRVLLVSVAGFDEGVLMPTCLDAFALGGWWGYVLYYNENPQEFIKKLAIPAILGALVFVYFCLSEDTSVFRVLFFRTSMSLFCLYFVAKASYKDGFSSIFGQFLNSAPLKYLGKISYGMYVYHMLVPAFILPTILKVMGILGIHLNLSFGQLIVANILVLLTVCTISWHLLESPINNLKNRFNI